MSIPDYETVMLPLLRVVGNGELLTIRDIREKVSDAFKLTDEQRNERLACGEATVIANRVGWAKTYLKNAGLIEQPKRGLVRITPEGRRVLDSTPSMIDSEFLKRYPSFVAFLKKTNKRDDREDTETTAAEPTESRPPEEVINDAYRAHREALAAELLDQVKSGTPAFFENVVVDLLLAMGYGNYVPGAGQRVGKSGDGGIDGVINEDKLGLDVVCIQAKKWSQGTVGRQEVQAFAGSMEAFRAKKGVFITTSTFSREAQEYVKQIERRIVLIDGERLAHYMIDHEVGVAKQRTISLMKIDSDYFEE